MDFPDYVLEEEMLTFLKELKLGGFSLRAFSAPAGAGGCEARRLGQAKCVYVYEGDTRRALYDLRGGVWWIVESPEWGAAKDCLELQLSS
jgi:hypothetical protein